MQKKEQQGNLKWRAAPSIVMKFDSKPFSVEQDPLKQTVTNGKEKLKSTFQKTQKIVAKRNFSDSKSHVRIGTIKSLKFDEKDVKERWIFQPY